MIYENIVGLIGEQISHSLSPLIHNSSFSKIGLSLWVYVPMPVKSLPKTNLKEAILGLRAFSFKGANVTIPYKELVLPYLDKLSKDAKLISAVNTIAIDEDGHLVGHNTDHLGFINDLLDHGLTPSKLSVLVLGAGGSAKAVIYGLLKHGCKNLTILNRHKIKADNIIHQYKDIITSPEIHTGTLEDIKDLRAFDLIVNCTSIGNFESKEQMPLPLNIKFQKSQVVYDLIYNPKKTLLLEKAEEAGAEAINGLGMLIHQASLAFKIWTKKDMPIEFIKGLII